MAFQMTNRRWEGYCVFLIIAILLFFSNGIFSNPIGSPYIKNFDKQIYEGGTQNWHIGSGKQGFIYFGNNKGLLEYDGTKWGIYQLPNFSIARSFACAGDSIFIGGQNEIGYLKADVGQDLVYKSLSDIIPENTPEFDDIWKIYIVKDQVFFCSEKVILKYKNGKIEAIGAKNGRFENFFLINQKLVVQDLSGGLMRLEDKQFNFISGSEVFINDRVVSILPFNSSDSLLYVTRNGRLFFGYGDQFLEWESPSRKELVEAKPYCAINLSNGNIAIGSSQKGLLIIDSKGFPLMLINEDNGLQNNTILSLYEDDHNNLWLGLDNGIDYIEINSAFRVLGPEFGIFGTGYSTFSQSGKLYMGTNQGLFELEWKEERNALDNTKFKQIPGAVGQVWGINEVNNRMIVSKHDGAYVLKGSKLDQFSKIQGSWKFAELLGHPGYAIQGTYTGLNIYSIDDKSNLAEYARLDGFEESARVFEEDKNGLIWVSHAYKGLYSIELSEDLRSIEKITRYDTTHGLPNNLFINVTRLRNEVLFTSTSGIYRFDESQMRFVEHEDFTKIFGQKRNFHRMLEDELGNIWFSVDNEFGVLSVQEKGVFNDYQIRYFNQIKNTLVDGFEHVFALNDQNIFIGSESGFIHFNPSNQSEPEDDFATLIRNVSLITDGDSTVYVGRGLQNGSSNLPYFNYQENDFQFAFSSPFYDKKDYIEYRYKLEGFENNWSDWSDKTNKEYTNLVNGEYRFLVQAKNAYGEVSSLDTYHFVIRPPWYFNTYTKILYVILILLSISLLVRAVYVREAKKRHQMKIDQKIQLETKEEAFKKEFEKSESEIIKLRNEKLQADINHKNSQLASSTMHLVQKSELLISLKNDIKSLLKDAPQDYRKRLQQIARIIDDDIQLDNNWEQFEHYFDQVHENFFKRLRSKYSTLTPKDQKLCAYLRMNLSTKEIAPLLNISVRGVEISRYRLRKKLDLDSNSNLVAHIMDI